MQMVFATKAESWLAFAIMLVGVDVKAPMFRCRLGSDTAGPCTQNQYTY